MINPILTPKEIDCIKHDRAIRRKLAKSSHYWFFLIYLSHYIKYQFAPFHHEMFKITEDESLPLAALVAFRGSGKTTLMSLSYIIWSIIGVQKRKFVLLLSQTQNQARLYLTNIKRELETNNLLKTDIGPFEEVSDEWGANSIVLSNYNARIMAASAEQSIRGVRHGEHRPDLVICDDVEDLNSVKTKEGRDKIFDWLAGEVMPIGDQDSKFIIVGNLLHEDCLLMRLKKAIEEKRLQGNFYSYPLLDESNQIAWPGKFTSLEDIDNLKKSIGTESAWFREYLLKIIAEEDRVVRREWIRYYDVLPSHLEKFVWLIAIGVDLAISEKNSADYTAIIPILVTGYGRNLEMYILPFILNKRLTFPETIQEIKKLSDQLQVMFKRQPVVYVENVGYQLSVVQQLTVEKVFAEQVDLNSRDKRSRLNITTPYIKAGKVLFPRHGAEQLISQLTNFGIEKHDDLADAFSILVSKVIECDRPTPEPPSEPRPPKPVYRNFGEGPIDMSKPLFSLDKKF